MVLKIDLAAKFRIFGIDLGNVKHSWTFQVPAEAALFAGLLKDHVSLNERGVSLSVSLVPALAVAS